LVEEISLNTTALLEEKERKRKKNGSIKDSLTGIIFFATPHRESDMGASVGAFWNLAEVILPDVEKIGCVGWGMGMILV